MLGITCAKLVIHLLLFWNLIASGKSHSDNFGEWGKISKICEVGERQSPIDISMENVIEISEPGSYLKLINYNNKSSDLTIKKNHIFGATLTGLWGNKKPAITGPALSNEVYVLNSVHIHWSKDDNDGTEHSIQGKKFAAELHSVHVNVKYANMTEAQNYPDGLAVIGTLYTVDNKKQANIGMKMFASIRHISEILADSIVMPFNFASFLPKSFSSFYAYNGSLTTPPCTENVRWIVVSKPLPIDSLTMDLLRKSASRLIDSKAVRPLQQINGRRIDLYDQNYY